MNAVKVINKQKNSGYIMADVGFVMLLANAFSYIFEYKISCIYCPGSDFCINRLKRARKSK